MSESNATDHLQKYWQKFLTQCNPEQAAGYTTIPEAWGFGDSPHLADALGNLVIQGIKTATCSAVWEYERDGEAIPKVGDLSIILDGRNQPLCIIETTEVRIIPFNEVDAPFAYAEGEDDRSLESWRREHWKYFKRNAVDENQMHESMPLVCERFRLIWKETSLNLYE
jgi:uncharacterized protein YhfF